MVCGLASFLCPGLGQALAGKPFEGLGWFCGTVLGYVLLIVPGLIVHYFCVKDALRLGEARERYLAICTAAEIEHLKRQAAAGSANAAQWSAQWKQSER